MIVLLVRHGSYSMVDGSLNAEGRGQMLAVAMKIRPYLNCQPVTGFCSDSPGAVESAAIISEQLKITNFKQLQALRDSQEEATDINSILQIFALAQKTGVIIAVSNLSTIERLARHFVQQVFNDPYCVINVSAGEGLMVDLLKEQVSKL